MTTTNLFTQRLGCADFITNSEIRHICDAGPAKQRKIAEAGNPARIGRTQYALTTDARQDKPGSLQLSYQSLEFLAWLVLAS